MGFRPPLDLTEIIEDYPALRDPYAPLNVRPKSGTLAADFDLLRQAATVRLDGEPWFVADGPPSCSSCTDLALSPEICWDVNGYYRELGVDWTASRKELMRAYVAADGQNSTQLTYILRQLLDPEVRREYDRTPLGERYLDDYVQDEIRMRAYDEVGRRARRGQEGNASQILDEWGYTINSEAAAQDPDDFGGIPPVTYATDDTPETGLTESWGFGYYLWQRDLRGVSKSRESLPTWQLSLIRAMSYRGVTLSFGVGLCTDTDREFAIRHDEGHPVFYLCAGGTPDWLTAVHAIDELRRS